MEVVTPSLSIQRLTGAQVFIYRDLCVKCSQEDHCMYKVRLCAEPGVKCKHVLVTMKGCTDKMMSILLMWKPGWP